MTAWADRLAVFLAHRRLTWLLMAVVLVTALTIALTTSPNTHPDEKVHLDAFGYFEGRWWPPDLNAEGLRYSPHGWSRVYTGEVVYILAGNLGWLVKGLWPQIPPWILYRLVNVALLAGLLVFLATRRSRTCHTGLLTALALGFPQLVYIFGYANSDAFGLTMSLVLFFLSLRLSEDSPESWTLGRWLGLGAVAGLVICAKPNYLASLVLPLWLLGRTLWQCRGRQAPGQVPRLAGLVLAGVLAAGCVAAPLKIAYPLTQGDWAAKVAAMREERAQPGFKPSNPTYFGLRLADKGEGYREVLGRGFVPAYFFSFWGVYGFMSRYNPIWLYYQVLALLAMAVVHNLLRAADPHLRQEAGPPPPRPLGRGVAEMLVCAVVVVGVSLSVLHLSLVVDYQPQGRYLYGAFVPILLLLGGAWGPDEEPPGLLRGTWVQARLLSLLSLFSLWFVLILAP